MKNSNLDPMVEQLVQFASENEGGNTTRDEHDRMVHRAVQTLANMGAKRGKYTMFGGGKTHRTEIAFPFGGVKNTVVDPHILRDNMRAGGFTPTHLQHTRHKNGNESISEYYEHPDFPRGEVYHTYNKENHSSEPRQSLGVLYNRNG